MSGSVMGSRTYGQHFEDVTGELNGFGSLGGTGIESHNKVSSKTKREGVEMPANCDNCGAPNVILADWQEVVYISVGSLPPNGWKYDSGHIRTDVPCRQCRRLLPVGVTPMEAKRWVQAAINAQFLSPQQANQIAAQAQQQRMR